MKRIRVMLKMASVFMFAAAPPAALAQQPPQAGQVRGVIAGGDDAPLATASVELYAHRDSSLAAGAISDDAGRFRIDGLRAGTYRLRVMYIGHQAHMQDVQVAGGTVDVGRVRLTAAAIALEGVQATAERGAVGLEVDRTVYRANQAAVAGGNATDVLRNVPGVDVDIDGKVSLRGTANVAVQINGRAAPVQGDALVNFLKQLPAAAIERVEVVPNPSARYDPEGMGGIINIVMQQNTSLGMSGGVNFTAGTGDKYNASGSLGYQAGRLTLFGTAGMNDDMRDSETFIFRSNHFTGQAPGFYQQNTTGELHNGGLMLNGTAEYRVTEHGVVFSGLSMNRLRGELGARNIFRDFDGDRTLLRTDEESSDLDQDVDIADLSIGFRRAAQPGVNELTSEARWNRADDALTSTTGGLSRDVSSVADNVTLQTDVVRRVAGMRLDFGQKFTFRGLDHDIRSGTNAESSDYDERILAGYALLSRDVGRLSLQGGMRVERTDTELGVQDTVLRNDYTNGFASAAALYSLSDARKLRLSYSRRIQRPNSRFMNPFSMQEDPRNVLVGNPALRPEMTRAVELSYQQTGAFGSLQLQPFFRRTTDAIRVTKTVDPAGVATTSFANLSTSTQYGADVNGTGRVGTRLNGSAGFSVFQMNTEGAVQSLGETLRSETLTWNARASLSWTVTPRLNAQWTLFHRAPMEMEQGRVRALTVTTLAVQQKLFADRASLTLRVSDPFDAMKMSFTTADANHDQTSWRKIESRIAQLSFAWSFGQQPRIRQRGPEDQAAAPPIF